MKDNSAIKDDIRGGLKILDDFANLYGNTVGMTEDYYQKIRFAIDNILLDYKRVLKENNELREYIMLAPNLDEMTAIKYRNIQEKAYFKGRAEEQQKARQIIYENYIQKYKIEEILKETEITDFNSLVETFLEIKKLLESE